MNELNFVKNGIGKSVTHLLQYASFVTEFAFYFGWTFINDAFTSSPSNRDLMVHDKFHVFTYENFMWPPSLLKYAPIQGY
tara:strand:- start:34 stop:273 length:240 start_codon:yes stop_codon:yes gene_type:complete